MDFTFRTTTLVFFVKHRKFNKMRGLMTGIPFVTSQSSAKDSRAMYMDTETHLLQGRLL